MSSKTVPYVNIHYAYPEVDNFQVAIAQHQATILALQKDMSNLRARVQYLTDNAKSGVTKPSMIAPIVREGSDS